MVVRSPCRRGVSESFLACEGRSSESFAQHPLRASTKLQAEDERLDTCLCVRPRVRACTCARALDTTKGWTLFEIHTAYGEIRARSLKVSQYQLPWLVQRRQSALATIVSSLRFRATRYSGHGLASNPIPKCVRSPRFPRLIYSRKRIAIYLYVSVKSEKNRSLLRAFSHVRIDFIRAVLDTLHFSDVQFFFMTIHNYVMRDICD